MTAGNTRGTSLLTGLLLCCSVAAGADGPPVTLAVAQRVELGAVSEKSWDNGGRWGQLAVSRQGELLFFYTNQKRKIVLQVSRDGRTFADPVHVVDGFQPAVTMDDQDNILLAFRGPGSRIWIKRMPRVEPGKWDLTAKASDPFARFGTGPGTWPSLWIQPDSRRIWCMYNYIASDIFSLPRSAWYPRRKPRGQAVVTFSDDGGESWAEPQYVGSDSGDEGSGVAILRSWRGHAAWFWTFWDCATPAWGFYDGSRLRGFREFFPHSRLRMAVGHPWDTLEDDRGGLYFATGIKGHKRSQLYKYFDGAKWSDEILLSTSGGACGLLNAGGQTFCIATEGRSISLYALDGTKAAARPRLYESPEGKGIFRPYSLPVTGRPKGYVPLFIVEGTPEKVGRRVVLRNQHVTYLRLEVRPTEGGAATSPVDVATLDDFFKPMPLRDARTEPRTDVPKDRKLIRVGDRWVLVHADDNPGRLLATPIQDGKAGTPAVLIDRPGWGRFQCAAVADGDDTLLTVCGEPDAVRFVRMTGVRDWKPKVTVRPIIEGGQWPTIGRASDGRLTVVAVVDGKLVTTASTDGGKSWTAAKAVDSPTPGPRPSLLQSRLLVGGRNGLWSLQPKAGGWGEAEQVVDEKWIGSHFSAVTDRGRIDVVYTAAESYLGRRRIGHVVHDGSTWRTVAVVDQGQVVRGVSLCSLGAGKLLSVYCVRNPRPEKVAKGVERMKRFTYTLQRKVFDGTSWQSRPAAIDWPDVPVHRPEKWKDWNEVGGVIYIPEVELGRFPVLPERAVGQTQIPVAWMVPGFHCMPKKERSPMDRGGLLVSTQIEMK